MLSTTVDSEKGGLRKEYHDGFADFAEYIASDSELSLYKGFASLTARNILYLQAELQVLEKELRNLDTEDQLRLGRTIDERERNVVDSAARAWEGITWQCEVGNERELKRMNLILKIREVVKQYEKALLRKHQILLLDKPERGTQEAFTSWFRHKKPLRGCGWHLLDDEKDIIALKTKDDPDRITSIIQYCFGYYFQDRRDNQPDSWGPMYYFKDSIISRIVEIITFLIAALFLIGAIILLYYVRKMGLRLGILSALTTAFAAMIGLLTNAKRVEIFAATAAYAAVLVVFVSGNISSN